LHIDRAVQLGCAAREGSETILTVGHSPDAAQAWVSALLAIRLPLYPKLRIQLISEFSSELIRSFLRRYQPPQHLSPQQMHLSLSI
jgi:hypothetical protein